MSEVKRDVCHACVSLPREIHCPVCDPEMGCRKELDAQRLRADTAEAELNALRLVFENAEDCELNDAEQKLAAAEQRIAEMRELLVEVQKAARKQAWAHGYPTLFAAVDAALNKKSEGESQ